MRSSLYLSAILLSFCQGAYKVQDFAPLFGNLDARKRFCKFDSLRCHEEVMNELL